MLYIYRINIRNSFERAQYLYVVYTMLAYVVSLFYIYITLDITVHMHIQMHPCMHWISCMCMHVQL